MVAREKPPTLASELAKKELVERLGMDVKGDPNDPLANKVNSVIPLRVVRDDKGMQHIGPNDRERVRRESDQRRDK